MQLYRQTYRAPDGTQREARVWRVRYYIRGVRHDEPLRTRDKRAAELIAADLVRRAELRAAGVVDPFEGHRSRSLSKHCTEFETTIAARGRVARYVAEKMKCLRAFAQATAATKLSDLSATKASEWLAGLTA